VVPATNGTWPSRAHFYERTAAPLPPVSFLSHPVTHDLQKKIYEVLHNHAVERTHDQQKREELRDSKIKEQVCGATGTTGEGSALSAACAGRRTSTSRQRSRANWLKGCGPSSLRTCTARCSRPWTTSSNKSLHPTAAAVSVRRP
jgi:hypothetical protein